MASRILDNPTDRSLISRFSLESGVARTCEDLISLQIEAGRIIQSALLTLAEMDENIRVSKLFPGMRAKSLQAPGMKIVAEVWKAVADGKPIPIPRASITRDDAKAYWILKSPDLRIIPYNTQERSEIGFLQEAGLDPGMLNEVVAQFLTPGTTWTDALQWADFSTPTAQKTVESIESFCGYQDRCLAEGSLIFRDPFTGSPLHPIDSCLLFGRSCYLYQGRHPMYLICAGAGAKALCLFLPKHNLIVDFKAGVSKFLSVNLFSNLLSLLTLRFMRNRERYNDAILADIDPACHRELIITAQQAANPAHHAWNFFPGFERAAKLESLGNITEVVFGGTEFYGPLDVIFPEFSGLVSHGERSAIIDPCPFSPQKTVLTLGGYFITRGLKERLKASTRSCTKGRFSIESVDAATRGSFPVLWFGLRMGDKSWVDQVSGFAKLANRILEQHPAAIFVLDGFLVPMGLDEVSGKWGDVKNTLSDLAEEIRRNVSAPDRVVNLVGASLGDGLLWAQKTDIYVSPVGSTQHRIGWFSDADGIVFSAPRGSRPLNLDRLPGAWEAEGIKRPEYIIGTPVQPGNRRGAGDRRSHLENVELDLSRLTAAVLSLVSNKAAANK